MIKLGWLVNHNISLNTLYFIDTVGIELFSGDSGPILLDEVQCTGNENILSECPHAEISNHDCTHFEDAGVKCLSGKR